MDWTFLVVTGIWLESVLKYRKSGYMGVYRDCGGGIEGRSQRLSLLFVLVDLLRQMSKTTDA